LTISDDVPAGSSFHEAVRSFKRELLRSAVRMHSGNKLKAARELGISRCYLHRLLNQLNATDLLRPDDEEEDSPRNPASSRTDPRDFALGTHAA
jgi:hypothetical protein